MAEKLAIDGGTPVLQRSDYKDWPVITDDDRKLINEVLDSGIFGGGTAPQVTALEKEWAEYYGVKHAVAVNSRHCRIAHVTGRGRRPAGG